MGIPIVLRVTEDRSCYTFIQGQKEMDMKQALVGHVSIGQKHPVVGYGKWTHVIYVVFPEAMRVPYLYRDKVLRTVMLDGYVHKKLKALADKHGVTLFAAIEEAVRDYYSIV